MRRLVVALALATVLLVAGPATAGPADPNDLTILGTSVEGEEVTVVVGAPDAGATADVFSVQENGEPVAVAATRLPPEALAVAIVIDTSGSTEGEPLAQAKAAATRFLTLLPAGSTASVVTAGAPAAVRQALGPAADAAPAIDALTAAGETAVWDGVATALDTLPPTGQRLVVLMTDGADTASAAASPDVAARVLDGGVSLISIALQTPDLDQAALDGFVAAAGGSSRTAADPAALDAAYSLIAIEVSSLWELRFTSTTSLRLARIDVAMATQIGTLGASTTVEVGGPAPTTTTSTTAAPTQPTAPELAVHRAPEPGPLGRSGVQFAGAALLSIAVVLAGLALRPPARGTRRLAVEHGVVEDRTTVQSATDVATRFTTGVLDRLGRRQQLDEVLDIAGLPLSPGDYVAVVGGCGVALGALLWVSSGLSAGLLGLAFVVLLGVAIPTLAIRRRRAAFAEQLADTLSLLAGSVRAGNSFAGALDAITAEAESPTGPELARITFEARLGRPITDALHRVCDRMANEDLRWVAEAIDMQRDVGGNLGEILDRLANTIRSRQRLHRQVQVLTAEGRMSAIVLLAMPFVLVAFMATANPDYMSPLFHERAGQVMIAVSLLLMTLGGLWLRKLVKVED